MAIITFDTLAFSKTMQDAGMDRNQAEALATAQREALSQMLDARDFATKTDVLETKSELKEDIANVRAEVAALRTELKEDIADVRAEVTALRTELKQDIADVRTEFKEDIANVRTEIATLRTELKQDIAKVEMRLSATENKMVKWFIGSVFAQTALFIAILSYMRG